MLFMSEKGKQHQTTKEYTQKRHLGEKLVKWSKHPRVKLMFQKGLALPYCRWKLKLERDEFHGAAWVKAQASKIVSICTINKVAFLFFSGKKIEKNYAFFNIDSKLRSHSTALLSPMSLHVCLLKVLKAPPSQGLGRHLCRNPPRSSSQKLYVQKG